MDFFNELSTATAALDASKKTYDGSDSYYSGNIQKWKKLGYSLMLRLGMRIQKVEPALAEQWVNAAIAGGVFTSNDDNQVFHHSSSALPNATNNSMRSNFARFRAAKTIVDMMTNTNDPRLHIYFDTYSGLGSLVGLPNGKDELSVTEPLLNPYDPTDPGSDPLPFNRYAYFNKIILANLAAPDFGVTYAEVCFLKAEAVLRGWITGDATALYEEGVKANMEQWGIYDGIEAPSRVPLIHIWPPILLMVVLR